MSTAATAQTFQSLSASARRGGLNKEVLRRLVRDGRLRAWRFGGKKLYLRPAEVVAALEALGAPAAARESAEPPSVVS